jgi:hypothetical protein
MACLAISYATGFPLIHNEVHGWPYKKKWKDAFEQLGSNCKINHETIRVSWQNKGPFMSNGNAYVTLSRAMKKYFTLIMLSILSPKPMSKQLSIDIGIELLSSTVKLF